MSAVFHGDTAHSQNLHFLLSLKSVVNVNSSTLWSHVDAHTDAPMHCANDEASAGELDGAPYLAIWRDIYRPDCGFAGKTRINSQNA